MDSTRNIFLTKASDASNFECCQYWHVKLRPHNKRQSPLRRNETNFELSGRHKQCVKSLFGATSPHYNQVSGLEFTNVKDR